MSFKTYLKSKLRYLFGVAMIAALLSQLISPLLSANAEGPRFNFLQGDYQILEGINTSRGDTVWKNPVTGTAGEQFRGSVYYHNGIVDTTATNTRVKVNIPQSTTNKSAKITASISADNAATVTSTIVDGQLVGMDGLVVNLDKDAELEFIPGSAKWFPNASTNNPGVTPTSFPLGQTGDEIISGNGVNIGSIQGCWQFAGFVTFGFRAKAKVAPSFTVDKTVRNVTNDGAQFIKEASAIIGDETEFKVDVTNTGDVAITNGLLRDVSPTGLEFVSGSFKKVSGTTVTPLSDTEAAKFFDGGITIDSLSPGNKVTYLFKTKVTSFLKDGDRAVNKVFMTAFGITLESQAAVKIVAKAVPNIVKKKSAFNDTKKKSATEVKNSVGDLVTYTLTTSNTGNASIDFEIRDDISGVLNKASVISISDGGQVVGSDIKWPSVNIKPGESVVRTFQVKIKDVAHGVCLKNTYGDTVTVCVDVPKILVPVLHIEKLVRNVTTNETTFVDSNQANAGDTLEYLINFSNTGDGPADRVKISDVLPPNTQYIAGTTRISRNSGSEQTLPDGITGAGITLDTISAGESDFIKFRVITSGSLAAGENLINTASINSISDTASTKIVARIAAAVTPVLPKTGATSAASFMITLFAGIALMYYKYKKLMNSEEVMIINSLVA